MRLGGIPILPTIVVICLALGSVGAAEPAAFPSHVTTAAQKAAWKTGWPRWGGPLSCGAGIDCGYELTEDLGAARLAWKSEEVVPNSELQPIRTGYCSPVVADGRVYLYYGWPNGLDVAKVVKATGGSHRAVGVSRDQISALADDVVLCLDATNGKTLWKRVFPKAGAAMMGSGKGGGHYTMCIRDGKAYAFGCGNSIYCLKADTGQTVWQGGVKNTKDNFPNACPLVAEGVLVFTNPADHVMHGFDANTGSPKWTTRGGVGGGTRGGSSPLLWKTEGRELIVINKSCVDPRGGKILWRLPGQGGVCTAVAGDLVLTEGEQNDCAAYRATSKGVIRAWALGTAYGIDIFSMPVVYRDHAYYMTNRAKEDADIAKRKHPGPAITAVDVTSGKVVGEAPTDRFNMYSANCAEGRFIWGPYMAKADPADFKQLSMLTGRGFDMAQDTSAAYVCGWLFRRGLEGISCYDLRKGAGK